MQFDLIIKVFDANNGDQRVLTKYVKSFMYIKKEEKEENKQWIYNNLVR